MVDTAEVTGTGIKVQTYDEKAIQSLDYPENIRKRPGMFIGGTGIDALHHVVYEVVDNAVDEAIAGQCSRIEITINEDGSMTVRDDGRGIPSRMHDKKKKSTLELIFTEMTTGGKFGGEGYKTSGGLHGVGVKATNATSEWLGVKVWRDGVVYSQRYEQGLPPLTGVGKEREGVKILHADTGEFLGHVGDDGYEKVIAKNAVKGQKTGTEITFLPDPPFFTTTKFDFHTLARRFQQIAFLIPSVTIEFTDRRGPKERRRSYHYDGGLNEYVLFLNEARRSLHRRPIYFRQEVEANGSGEKVVVECAMQYHASADADVVSFVNIIPTPEGGKHVSGFQAGLTKAINAFASEKRMLKGQGNISGKDTLFGVTVALLVLMPEPQFTSQTKRQLATDYMQGLVASVTYNALLAHFQKNVSLGRTIVQQCLAAAETRRAEAKVRQTIMRRTILESSELPGKLADTSDREPKELTFLYIVEGDSAGGSCKQGRDRHYHAILPLRGKFTNVERAKLSKAMSNNDVKSMVSCLGTGVGHDFNIEDMRYGGVCILVDADDDGGHIGTLLLTLAYRYFKPLVQQGRLFWARAPLYQVRSGNKSAYAYTDEERDALLKKWGAKATVQRYKGLGEMNPSQLRETVFAIEPQLLEEAREESRRYNRELEEYTERAAGGGAGDEEPPVFRPVPLNHNLVRITLDDVRTAEATVQRLMGASPMPRRKWLMRRWHGVDDNGNGDADADADIDDDELVEEGEE